MRQIDQQLIQACFDQDYQKIPELLDAGADPNAIDEENGWSPLSSLVYSSARFTEQHGMFIHGEFWKAIELLLQKGADINLVIKADDDCISTALMESQYTIPEVAQFLLEHGADPDVINEEQETILDAIEFCLWADYEDMWRDHSDYWVTESRIRKILLDHGAHRASTLEKMAEFEKRDEIKQKVFHACWHLEAEKLDEFLCKNSMSFSDKSQGDLLYAAVEEASEFTQKFFVDDPTGYEERLIATLSVLRKHGCNLGGNEENALYHAVRNGFVKTVRYLLACGLDPKKCNCGYWCDSRNDLPEHRHYYSLADKVRHWRCRWKEETALAFQEMFPSAEQ